jgi:hypothetical protein
MGLDPESETCFDRSGISFMRVACVVKVDEDDGGGPHRRSGECGVRGMTVKVRVESGGWIWARAHKLLLEPRRDRRRVFVDKLIVKALEELFERYLARKRRRVVLGN